jgi:hypothetical protein
MTARAGAVSFQWEQEMAAQGASTLQGMFLRHVRDTSIEIMIFLLRQNKPLA